MESPGPLGSKAKSFLSALSFRITASTSGVKESSYLYQRILKHYRDLMRYVYITLFVIYCTMTTMANILVIIL